MKESCRPEGINKRLDINIESWNNLIRERPEWLIDVPLIFRFVIHTTEKII